MDGGQDVGAVLGGGGDVPAYGVPVAGDLLGAEPAGDLLLGLGWPQVALPFCTASECAAAFPCLGFPGQVAVREPQEAGARCRSAWAGPPSWPLTLYCKAS